MSDAIHFRCPHCQAKFKVMAQHAGRRFDCPKCSNNVAVPKPAAQPAAAAPAAGAAEWDELVAYLRSGKPADITKIGDPSVIDNVNRYYETVAADPDHPKLTYYLLAAADRTTTPPFLVVSAGDRDTFERAWHFDCKPLLQKAHPGFSWDDLWKNSASDVSNHSKPGCSLDSIAPFDRLVKVITDRKYLLKQVLRPASPAPSAPTPPARRWSPDEAVPELVRLIGDDAGFGNKEAIRAIGKSLNHQGGMDLMQKVYYQVRKHVYFSQDIWDGVGRWRC